MASEASKTAEHASEDQGQTASTSQPSPAPTAAEPRNTNTEYVLLHPVAIVARSVSSSDFIWRHMDVIMHAWVMHA
jgi:hypothetical protein